LTSVPERRILRGLAGPMNRRSQQLATNQVRRIREQILMSKAELARRAGISPLTVNRVESGEECRLATKRKIILALGKSLEERAEVFPELVEISANNSKASPKHNTLPVGGKTKHG
jgi:DNA-binding XRE family transcriptional regulator